MQVRSTRGCARAATARFYSLLSFLALFILFTCASQFNLAHAQGQPRLLFDARPGFDGFCKPNHWLPVQVTMENSGEPIEGRLEVVLSTTNNKRLVFSQPITLPAPSRKITTLNAYVESCYSPVDVRLVSGNRELASTRLRLQNLPEADLLIGVLSDNKSAFNDVTGFALPNRRAHRAEIDIPDLPAYTQAYDSLDWLIVSGKDTSTIQTAQLQALYGWLAGGGQLLIIGGPDWQKSTAGFQEMLPLVPTGTQNSPNINSLPAYLGLTDPLAGEITLASGDLAAEGYALVKQDDQPVLAVRQVGFGRVLYLAADPTLKPLKDWEGLPDLYRKMVDTTPARPPWIDGFINWSDADEAVTNIRDLNLPSLPLLAGFLGLYILIIGPINYWLLRRLKRQELAWVTIPGMAVIFTLLAYFIGLSEGGVQPVLTRLAVVQSWQDAPLARLDGVLGVFSPRRATYTLQVSPPGLVRGLQTGAVPDRLQPSTFRQEKDGSILVPDLRVDVAESQAVAVQRTAAPVPLSSDLSIHLSNADPLLSGQINWRGDSPLLDVILYGPGISSKLGTFQPGLKYPLQVLIEENFPASPIGLSFAIDKNTIANYLGVKTPLGMPLTAALMDGTSYYQSGPLYQRYHLAHAITPYQDYLSTPGSLFLIGWSEASSLDASLVGKTPRVQSTSLLINALKPSYQFDQKSLKLPPALFLWSVLEGDVEGFASPYQVRLAQNPMAMRFTLARPLDFQAVESLTVHLVGSDTSSAPLLRLYLWNFATQAWDDQIITGWGNLSISDPQHYVAPGGEVRIRLEPFNDRDEVLLERVDFTLVVQP